MCNFKVVVELQNVLHDLQNIPSYKETQTIKIVQNLTQHLKTTVFPEIIQIVR